MRDDGDDHPATAADGDLPLWPDGDAAPPATDPAPPVARPHRRRGRNALIAGLVSLLVLLGGVAGAGAYLVEHYGGKVTRIPDVFTGVTDRPAAAPQDARTAQTWLLVGSDTRADIAAGELPDARSDVIMLVHLTADRRHAQVVSIPRDSWVSIPGAGMSKINAAYSYGGPSLLVATLERLTGIRIDHFVAFDFQGFVTITDALGGVDVDIAADSRKGDVRFSAGENHLDGERALAYVRERKDLPGGDFDRVKRQQQVIASQFAKLRQQDVFSDLGTLTRTLDALTGAMAVDDTVGNTELVELAWSLRHLTPATTTFLTAPVAGTGTEGAQSVVHLDPAADATLWRYLKTDTLTDHAREFRKQLLPDVPN